MLSVAVVDSVDDAVNMANTSDYTLGATLWTTDVSRALDVANRVRAGTQRMCLDAPYSNIITGLVVINGEQTYQETYRESVGLG